MPTVAHNARLNALVAPDVEVVALASGYRLTEGPVWHPAGYLLFSEIPSSTRMRWRPSDGARPVAHPTNRGNGMAFDPAGNLIVCEHETSCVVRLTLDADGATVSREVVASHVGDLELNAPNDVVVRSDGTIFFTDPTYGRIEDWVGKVRPLQLDYRGVYAVTPDGALRCVARDFHQPNGLCLSADERTLYVNDSADYLLRRFDVAADGGLTGGEIILDKLGDAADKHRGFCDGMKCDVDGNVWVTGPDGIWVVSPQGEHLGTVLLPEQAHNLAWGGDDWSSLFVMNSSAIYRFETLTRAARTH